jgi:hypothetical protein
MMTADMKGKDAGRRKGDTERAQGYRELNRRNWIRGVRASSNSWCNRGRIIDGVAKARVRARKRCKIM